MLILWAWTAILSGFLLVPLFMHRANAFIPLGAAALGVGLYTLFHPGLRKGNGEAADEAADDVVPVAPGSPRRGSRREERKRACARAGGQRPVGRGHPVPLIVDLGNRLDAIRAEVR